MVPSLFVPKILSAVQRWGLHINLHGKLESSYYNSGSYPTAGMPNISGECRSAKYTRDVKYCNVALLRI